MEKKHAKGVPKQPKRPKQKPNADRTRPMPDGNRL